MAQKNRKQAIRKELKKQDAKLDKQPEQQEEDVLILGNEEYPEIETFEDITKYICENAKPGDLVLTMGGGNVYMCANMILKALKTEE